MGLSVRTEDAVCEGGKKTTDSVRCCISSRGCRQEAGVRHLRGSYNTGRGSKTQWESKNISSPEAAYTQMASAAWW